MTIGRSNAVAFERNAGMPIYRKSFSSSSASLRVALSSWHAEMPLWGYDVARISRLLFRCRARQDEYSPFTRPSRLSILRHGFGARDGWTAITYVTLSAGPRSFDTLYLLSSALLSLPTAIFFFCARAKNAISHEFLRGAENVAEREKRISPDSSEDNFSSEK